MGKHSDLPLCDNLPSDVIREIWSPVWTEGKREVYYIQEYTWVPSSMSCLSCEFADQVILLADACTLGEALNPTIISVLPHCQLMLGKQLTSPSPRPTAPSLLDALGILLHYRVSYLTAIIYRFSYP